MKIELLCVSQGEKNPSEAVLLVLLLTTISSLDLRHPQSSEIIAHTTKNTESQTVNGSADGVDLKAESPIENVTMLHIQTNKFAGCLCNITV